MGTSSPSACWPHPAGRTPYPRIPALPRSRSRPIPDLRRGLTVTASAATPAASPGGAQGGDWPAFLGASFTAGAVAGTLLDGIHSRVGLQV